MERWTPNVGFFVHSEDFAASTLTESRWVARRSREGDPEMVFIETFFASFLAAALRGPAAIWASSDPPPISAAATGKRQVRREWATQGMCKIQIRASVAKVFNRNGKRTSRPDPSTGDASGVGLASGVRVTVRAGKTAGGGNAMAYRIIHGLDQTDT